VAALASASFHGSGARGVLRLRVGTRRRHLRLRLIRLLSGQAQGLLP
jgi:hypothetical protein